MLLYSIISSSISSVSVVEWVINMRIDLKYGLFGLRCLLRWMKIFRSMEIVGNTMTFRKRKI